MLFLVMGTPWNIPRTSRFCCPDCGDGGFGGTSSTRTATLRMRLRNSCGSESSVSPTTLTKYSRFILHPLKQIRACSLRVAVVFLIIFFAVAFDFLFVRARRPEGKLIKSYHRTSEITYLNVDTFGWDWGVHSCRP